MEVYQYNQELVQQATSPTGAAEFSGSPPALLARSDSDLHRNIHIIFCRQAF